MSIKGDIQRAKGASLSKQPLQGNSGGASDVRIFETPGDHLGRLSPEALARVLATAADFALVLDQDGQILDFAKGVEPAPEGLENWPGQSFTNLLTKDSLTKAEQLLAAARAGAPATRWSQLSHPQAEGEDLPVAYLAEGLPHARVLLLARSLAATAQLQQQLLDAQYALERDYWDRRQAASRYRVFFQHASEVALFVDAQTERVLEANEAALQWFDLSDAVATRRPIGSFFASGSQSGLQGLLARLRHQGEGQSQKALVAAHGEELGIVRGEVLQHSDGAVFLLWATPEAAVRELGNFADAPLAEAAAVLRDGLAVVDGEGRIQAANAAFLTLAELAQGALAEGQALDQWLGRTPVDVRVLLKNLRQHGVLTPYVTQFRGRYGATAEVEVSGAQLPGSGEPRFALSLRDLTHRSAAAPVPESDSPRSIDQLTELVGRVPLRDVIRESNDVIERLCIEAALQLTGGNRASAAEMLGLSRQSLYVKLRRYGLMERSEES
jgi:transcriptional regulator PpsR